MSLATDRCICLRKVEYSETSQILLLFARTRGLVRVIAKGAHRVTKQGASKFGGGIDLLDVGHAVFTDRPEKDLATLTEWKLAEGHLPLKSSLRGLFLAFYAAELVSILIEEHDPHPELFDRIEQTALDLATPRAEQAFLAFQLDLLRETGFLPHIQACVSCGLVMSDRPATAWYSPARGGVVCRNCESTAPDRSSFDGRLLSILQHVLSLASAGSLRKLPVLTRHQTDPINWLLAQHVEHTTSRRLRAARYILRGQSNPRYAGIS